jgi:hypothetical protein
MDTQGEGQCFWQKGIHFQHIPRVEKRIQSSNDRAQTRTLLTKAIGEVNQCTSFTISVGIAFSSYA